MKTIVVNVKTTKEFDILIMRPTIWGNPFTIGKHGDRKQVVRMHYDWLKGIGSTKLFQVKRSEILYRLEELRGKVIACCCDPLPCHGHNYLILLGERENIYECR